MYNIVFLPQLERFKEDLFGAGCVDVRASAEEASRRYVLPDHIKTIPCVEDTNGEWVPVTSLERKV